MKMKPKYTHVKLDQFFMNRIMVYHYTLSKFKVRVMRSTCQMLLPKLKKRSKGRPFFHVRI
jgi:hypothetical protein